MEIIIEFIFDIIVDGSLNFVFNKKLPKFIRVLMGLVLSFVYGGIFLMLVSLMFLCLRTHGYLMAFVLLFINIFYSYMMVKVILVKFREGHHEIEG